MQELAAEHTTQEPERTAQWLLGAAFTEFVRNPSALHWRALEDAMAQYQQANKST